MGTKSVFRGNLSFALLSIGIKAYKATGISKISFKMLHNEDASPIEMKRQCKKCGKEIEWNELVKGFEIDKEHYIVFSDDEIASLTEEGTKAIKITECVSKSMVDTLALGDFYYLVPEKGFSRAYLLLREALRSINGALIGKWVYHGRENIVCVTPREDVMVLTKLRYAEEITSVNEIPATIDVKDTPSADEIKLGIELLKKFSNPKWKLPDSSEYVKKFEALMNAKSVGAITGSLEETKEVKAAAKPKDLMDELRGSLMVMTSATASASVSASVSASEMNVGAEVQEIDGKKEEKTEKAKEKAKRSKKKKE